MTELAGAVRTSLTARIVATRPAEVYVGRVLDDGTVIEGFVDLMYQEENGSTVIVEYKTDDIPDAAIAVRAEYYRPQIEAYLRCAEAAGLQSARGVLLFLDPRTQARVYKVN